MPVVITLLLLYSVACFILAIDFQNKSGVVSTWVTKWIYCTSVVNQILSPLLPVALEVGQIQVR
jgi:cation-transporting ATPase 13A3/4/5